MKTPTLLSLAAVLLLSANLLAGCGTTNGSAAVYGGTSYGVGWADPWNSGFSDYPPDLIVAPPPARPVTSPEPDANPPSIPSSPKPSPRGGRR